MQLEIGKLYTNRWGNDLCLMCELSKSHETYLGREELYKEDDLVYLPEGAVILMYLKTIPAPVNPREGLVHAFLWKEQVVYLWDIDVDSITELTLMEDEDDEV